uniref:C2H2-type domain-containing protein n=1 Tax=Heliothis virescens TaxID=7102 RepID=A0A2A4K4S3_HELVI
MLKEDFVNAMFRCERCILSFPNAEDLKDHISIKHDLNASKFKCTICECSFATDVSFNYHTNKHKKRYECIACSERCFSKRGVLKHYDTVHYHGKLKESLPEDGTNLEKHQQKVDQIKCLVNSAKEKYPCPQCDKKFQWRGNLLRHLNSHVARANGELVCEPCNRTFSSIATYKQHMKISRKHVSENDFKYMCSECGKRFANKTRLKDHVDWEHLKNYVHTCNVCQKVFKSHTSLYLHKQVVHKKDSAEHLCDHCGKPFPNQGKLRCHVVARHSGASHACGSCGARFSWLSCLSRHCRNLHPKVADTHA